MVQPEFMSKDGDGYQPMAKAKTFTIIDNKRADIVLARDHNGFYAVYSVNDGEKANIHHFDSMNNAVDYFKGRSI